MRSLSHSRLRDHLSRRLWCGVLCRPRLTRLLGRRRGRHYLLRRWAITFRGLNRLRALGLRGLRILADRLIRIAGLGGGLRIADQLIHGGIQTVVTAAQDIFRELPRQLRQQIEQRLTTIDQTNRSHAEKLQLLGNILDQTHRVLRGRAHNLSGIPHRHTTILHAVFVVQLLLPRLLRRRPRLCIARAPQAVFHARLCGQLRRLLFLVARRPKRRKDRLRVHAVGK